MKRKFLTVLVSILVAGLALGACDVFVNKGTDLMAEVEAATWPDDPSVPDPAFVAAMNDFSWDMVSTIDAENGNMMVSPASVYLALAMTLNGADEQTKTDMLKALASEGLTPELINQAARDWMIRLNKTDSKNRLSIVNSIWYREGFAADKQFLQTNADFFGAAAHSLDFNDSKSADAINSWVKKSTEGRIDKIVDTISKDTVMFLINAIYFKAEWRTKFASKDTRSGSFQSPEGMVDVRFMNRTGSMDYIKTEDAEGVLLPYNDQRFAFVALLPNEGVSPKDLAGALDAETMDAIMANRQTKDITLSLPKFEAEYSSELKDTLTSLGMGIAFEPGLADFSLMQESRAKDLFIMSVLHKTFIRVDEQGTEAAAVTKVEIGKTSLPVAELTIEFDRPFLYMIIDSDSNLPLFIGTMEKP